MPCPLRAIAVVLALGLAAPAFAQAPAPAADAAGAGRSPAAAPAAAGVKPSDDPFGEEMTLTREDHRLSSRAPATGTTPSRR